MKFQLIFILGLVLAAQGKQNWEEIEKKIGELKSRNENFDPESQRVIGKKFLCEVPQGGPSRPKSVHQLRPSDIEVVAALGDSLTAANGGKATFLPGVLQEDRGVSWSIGGEENNINDLVTLPNILRQFNSGLYGYSTGTGKVGSKNAGFNVGHPGDTAYDMPGQAKTLVDMLRKSDKIDFANSWKVITLFIGGNDQCDFCDSDPKQAVIDYIQNVRDAIDHIHQNVPRVLFNLVSSLNTRGIKPLTGFTCRTMQNLLCGCALDDDRADDLEEYVAKIQEGVEELVNSGRYDTHDNFTVVVQTFMNKMAPPKKANGDADHSYFAPDCFHFSSKGHGSAAVELWNSMITPVGDKPIEWVTLNNPNIPCPASPYFYTNKNSARAKSHGALKKLLKK